MTVTITAEPEDVSGHPDDSYWVISTVLRQGSTGKLVTDKAVRVYPVNGALSTQMEPGYAKVTPPRSSVTYAVTVPDTDADMWDLIAAAITIPPNTSAQMLATLIDDYLAAHPPVSVTDVVSDTTPQLGGNLDPNGHTVGDATAADLTKLHGITASAATLNAQSGTNTGDQTIPTALPPTLGSVTTTSIAAATLVTAAETIAANNNDTTIPTSAAVQAAITALIGGAPGALDTLKELADAINDDASYAATITTALGGKQPLDADLTAIAALTTQTFGRSLLTAADAAAARTAIGVTAATVVSVKDAPYSAVGDGTTNDRAALAAADAAALAAGVPLLLPAGTYRVSTSLTIASPAVFQPGAIIKPSSGQTVTLADGLSAPFSKIFDHSAGGVVVPKNVFAYHPCWWGAVNGINDSQAWIDMAASNAASVTTFLGIPFGQRIMAPTGLNRIIGVTLSSCMIDAPLGTCVFAPPTATTSGVMLTLGNYADLRGGSFTTDQTGQAVTCLFLQGYRARADGSYVFNQAANSVGVQLGSTGSGSTSPILSNVRIISGNSTPASGSIGLDVQSADVECTNVMSAQFDIGIKGTSATSGRWVNVHVWGNNTGISGDSWDDTQITNLYLDSNRGWGVDIDKIDRANWAGVVVWSNGAAIGSTGGMRFKDTAGSAQRSSITGVVLDDNTGTGIVVDGPADYEIEATLCSSSVQGGGAVVTTTGVSITSATSRLRLRLRGTDATTPVSDSSTSTLRDVGPPIRKVAGSNLVKNASAALAVFLSIPAKASTKYVVRGALVVDGNAAADMQFRIQASSSASPSGWFASSSLLANSSSGTSAASVHGDNTQAIAASAGNTLECGLITGGGKHVVDFIGFVTMGTGSNQSLDCMVAQDVSDASDTTFYAGSWMEIEEVA